MGSKISNNAPMPGKKAKKSRKRWYLREWREHRGLTGEELAEKLGWAKSQVSELETGKQRYNQDSLEALANALECEESDLLSVDPEKSPADTAGLVDAVRGLRDEDVPRATAVIRAFELPVDNSGVNLEGGSAKKKTRRTS